MHQLSNLLTTICILCQVVTSSRFCKQICGYEVDGNCDKTTYNDMACRVVQEETLRISESLEKTKNFRIHLTTWNVALQDPPLDFTDMLHLRADHLPDIYAIGLQEANHKSTGSSESHPWTFALTDVLFLRGYVRVKTIRLQGLLLVLFVKSTHLLHLTNVEAQYTRTGLGGLWGNKGAVSIRMDINGVNTCIVNCHLAAHLNEVGERIEDFYSIIEEQKFDEKDAVSVLDHDYVFWIGDLNFRIDDLSCEEIKKRISAEDYSYLWDHDQLNKCRDGEVIFLDFEEGPLTFAPTYKFDLRTDNYDTSKKERKPAWCDRILWMVHEDSFEGIELDAKQIYYKAHPTYRVSDHKPVSALFSIVVLAEPPPSPVTFSDTSRWYPADNSITYKLTSGTKISSWDWIGLYRSKFRDFKDYQTYVWADTNVKDDYCRVKFRKEDLPPPGKYVLCYISSVMDSLFGMSEEFELAP